MQQETTPNSGPAKAAPYSYPSLVKDAFIVLLALLPEAAQRIALLFTDKPLIPWLQERGWSLSWLLGVTVPLALLVFYREHRIKAKDEAAFLFKHFPKNAPAILVVLICGVFLLILHSCNVTSENARLGGMLALATNPPSFFATNTPVQISLSANDVKYLDDQTFQFAQAYSKTNGHAPKVTLYIFPTSTSSRHLFRQIRDAARHGGWTITTHNQTLQLDPGKGIFVYTGDIANPPPTYFFWLKTFEGCSLDANGVPWGKPIGDEVYILINDPVYFE